MFELLSSFKRNGSELPLTGNYWRLPLTDKLVPLEKLSQFMVAVLRILTLPFKSVAA